MNKIVFKGITWIKIKVLGAHVKDLRGCGLKLDTTEGSGGLNARPGARLQGIQKF